MVKMIVYMIISAILPTDKYGSFTSLHFISLVSLSTKFSHGKFIIFNLSIQFLFKSDLRTYATESRRIVLKNYNIFLIAIVNLTCHFLSGGVTWNYIYTLPSTQSLQIISSGKKRKFCKSFMRKLHLWREFNTFLCENIYILKRW